MFSDKAIISFVVFIFLRLF